MSEDAPGDGDRVLITIPATVDSEGDHHLAPGVVGDCSRPDHWIRRQSVVKVEPAPRHLPTEIGSLILAWVHFGDANPRLLKLVHERIRDDDPMEDAWCVVGARDWVRAEDIVNGWVQIDPSTLRPLEDPS